MNRRRHDAAERLALILEHENNLLERFDYPGVGACCEEKRLALAELENSPGESAGSDSEADTALAARLGRLIRENRLLLERALRIQDRIMGIIAGAARRNSESTLYAAGGYRPRPPSNRAVALLTKA
jgi:hypothetical protein